MKLIERYLEAGSLEARSTTTVRSDWPLSRDGRVSSILSLELAAQTAAAVTEWKTEYQGGEDHFGFLAGVKNTSLLVRDFQVGDTLETVVSCAHLLNSSGVLYGTFQAGVSSGTDLLAEVSVRIVASSAEELASQDGLWRNNNMEQMSGPDPEPAEGFRVLSADPWLPLSAVTGGDGRPITARSRTPRSSGWFDGHFPGRPLLPGVVMISLAAKTVEDWAANQGRIARLRGYKKVKFKQMVLPDQEMIINVNPGLQGDYTFEVSGLNGSMCTGILHFFQEIGPGGSGDVN